MPWGVSMFTENEIAFRARPLARLATVSDDARPDAAAVGVEFDGAHVSIGGHTLAASRTFK